MQLSNQAMDNMIIHTLNSWLSKPITESGTKERPYILILPEYLIKENNIKVNEPSQDIPGLKGIWVRIVVDSKAPRLEGMP